MEIRTNKNQLMLREVQEGESGIGVLEGYISVFNSDSEDMGYIEQIKPGAFAESLRDNDIVALVNHQTSVVVGRTGAGTLKLNEDNTGLHFSLDLPDTQAGRDLKTLVARGDLKGCSFGFSIDPEDMRWSKRDGKDFAEITNLNLAEVSVGVTFPAYPATSMALRQRQQSEQVERDRVRAKAKNEIYRHKHK